MQKTFNYCCTLLGTDTLNEGDVRALLDLPEDAALEEKDWILAMREMISSRIDSGVFFEEFNDIDMQEVAIWKK